VRRRYLETESMAGKKEKAFAIRITDKGAIAAVLQTTDALIHISSILRTRKITDVDELVQTLKQQLGKYLQWLDRVPDGTLLSEGMTREQLKNIRDGAKAVMRWKIVPSDKDYAKLERNLQKLEAKRQQREELVENRIRVMMDTSFLLSYLSHSESNSSSTQVVVSYLKTQKRYFDLCLPNLVLLELISKLKQKHPFKRARMEFERLLDEICESRVGLSDGKMTLFEIFERYEKFSKKKLSSSLRSNDFIIATDAILAKAMFLTCDRKMHDGIKKTHADVFHITGNADSYLGFIKRFEKRKQTMTKQSTQSVTNTPAPATASAT